VRLSRPRVVLRAVLLVFLGGFLAWRAWQTGRSAGEAGLEPGQARLLGGIAVAEAAFAGVALFTAGAVALALRPRARQRLLDLRGPNPKPAPGLPPAQEPP
jgi:hypothetical protein